MKNSKHVILLVAASFIIGFLTSSCKKEISPIADTLTVESQIVSGNLNIQPFENGTMPKATIKLKKFDSFNKNSRNFSTSLSPASFETFLAPGSSVSEDLTATITLPLQRGDVMFMFDLTKSMQQELANVKVNSQNIMGAIGSVISDVNFGVVSHMDYIGSYDFCGYDDRYGGSAYGDYPYQLGQSISVDTSLVAQAINSLQIGWGWDYPECYTRVLYELSATDAGIGWRQSSKRIVVAWLDNQPHDCSLGTGPDPGRDEIVDTEDDLDINNVLAQLADENIVLFVLYSGGDPLGGDHLEIWEDYCNQTGGGAFRINQDGSIPDDIDIDDYIRDIIQEEVSHIDNLYLEVCTSGFENWLTNVAPSEYTDINDSGTFPFTIEITVPAGTADGVYEFDICLLGDGMELGIHHIKIRVFDGIGVPFDFKPHTCPNPLNRSLSGTVPGVISGFPGFNVRDINIASLNILGVHKTGPTSYANNLADPYYPFLDKEFDANSCITGATNDGFEDLFFKFDNEDLSLALSGYHDGDLVRIYIEGNLNDGTKILGEDIIQIIGETTQGIQLNPR
jgi:hypothetical protein